MILVKIWEFHYHLSQEFYYDASVSYRGSCFREVITVNTKTSLQNPEEQVAEDKGGKENIFLSTCFEYSKWWIWIRQNQCPLVTQHNRKVPRRRESPSSLHSPPGLWGLLSPPCSHLLAHPCCLLTLVLRGASSTRKTK